MGGPRASRALVLCAFAFAWIASLWLLGGVEAVAYLAPVLAVLLPLLFGVYVGEKRLLAHRESRPARPVTDRGLPRRPDLPAVRGGLLIAASLAERAPPLLLRS
jgi:hypothetical protein